MTRSGSLLFIFSSPSIPLFATSILYFSDKVPFKKVCTSTSFSTNKIEYFFLVPLSFAKAVFPSVILEDRGIQSSTKDFWEESISSSLYSARDLEGNTTEKRVSTPGLLLAEIVPSSKLTRDLQNDRPMPPPLTLSVLFPN